MVKERVGSLGWLRKRIEDADTEPPRVLRRVCYLSPATVTGAS